MTTKLNKGENKTFNLHKQLETITNGKLELNTESLLNIGLLLQHLGCELALLSRSEQHKETQESARAKQSEASKKAWANPELREKQSEAKISTEFGRKYKEHFCISANANLKQYLSEYQFYHRHGFCRWELSNICQK